jgi:hypothetical protein
VGLQRFKYPLCPPAKCSPRRLGGEATPQAHVLARQRTNGVLDKVLLATVAASRLQANCPLRQASSSQCGL